MSTYNLLLSFFLGREEGMMQWGDLREKFKEKKWKRNFFTYPCQVRYFWTALVKNESKKDKVLFLEFNCTLYSGVGGSQSYTICLRPARYQNFALCDRRLSLIS